MSTSPKTSELIPGCDTHDMVLIHRVFDGSLARDIDPEDRRRLVIELTERGQAAEAAMRAGLAPVDDQLGELCSPTRSRVCAPVWTRDA